MIVLTGATLNKRHQEFNTKVNEAAENKVDFEEIRYESETSDVDKLDFNQLDVDKLFEIDLASKYKNIDYILEILQSGDSLYISRALRCDWIIDDEFAQFMNPKYLETNIFPYIAPKIKKKVLSTLSSRLRNGERAQEFHHYCMHSKMYKLGMDFLLYTNESFKIEILTLHPHVYNDFDRHEKYLEHFIGKSFLLAEHYLKVISESSRSWILYKLRYLYSVSEEKYLDLLETCPATEGFRFHRTSLKLSQNIMKKHKNRVLKNPWLYLHTLDPNIVSKYSTSDDAKVYAVNFLPLKYHNFWSENYYLNNRFFLDLIPLGERFSFVKKIFTEKYPGEMFEDNYTFYTSAYYEMMTEQEKENWALSQIASGRELHGCDNDYIWYRFVNFQLALVEIKKFILIAPDNDKRTNIVKILVESAKTQVELTTLMTYYYDRHVNELKEYKRNFINEIIEKHNLLKFNEDCWNSLEKILHSLEVYHKLSEDYSDYENNEYRVLSFIYHIIHENPVPEVLHEFLLSGTITVGSISGKYCHYMESREPDMIYHYTLTYFTNHITPMIQPDVKHDFDELLRLINCILDVVYYYNKEFEEISEDIRNFISNNYERFKFHQLLYKPEILPKLTEGDIIRYLKEDSSLVISDFETIKKYFTENRKKNLNWLIRKLNIYFTYDLAPKFIKLLEDCLNAEELRLRTAKVAVYGILNLSDTEHKVNFLEKYVPVDAKIDHGNISRNLLNIQMAICMVACHSGPRLPLYNFRKYIEGDYLKFSVCTFDAYLANLPPAQCLCFVESLIDCPVSVQKHGLRLAFRVFNSENLRNLILKAWKKTKNVSVRKVLFKALFDKVNYYHDNLPAQWELFGALNIMINDLHQDDSEEVFSLLHSTLPRNVFGVYLQSAYIVVNTFPKREINYQRLIRVIQAMESNIELISKNVLLAITEDHIKTMFDQEQILNTRLRNVRNDLCDVFNAKWSLIKTIIIKHNNINFLQLITDKTLINWHKTSNGIYVYRRFFIQMLYDLESRSYSEPSASYLEINNIFRLILTHMENVIPHIEIYILVWRLKLNILTRQVLCEEIPKIDPNEKDVTNIPAEEIILKFSHEVKNLMAEYIKNGKFFISLSGEIKATVDVGIMKIESELCRFVYDAIKISDIYVLLCSVLSEWNIREIQIFVMNSLPQDYHGVYAKRYLDVIYKLKSVDDNEIKYFLWHKFYSSIYQYKDFMA